MTDSTFHPASYSFFFLSRIQPHPTASKPLPVIFTISSPIRSQTPRIVQPVIAATPCQALPAPYPAYGPSRRSRGVILLYISRKWQLLAIPLSFWKKYKEGGYGP